MSPLTAGLFFILGACAAAGLARGRGTPSPAAAWGAAFAAAFSTVVLIGYVYRVPLFYGGRVIPMAATTAACFLALSAALLAETGRGLRPWRLFEGDSPAPRMMRSFLPLFAGFILLMGFLSSRSSVVSSPLAAALILLVSLPCMAWMVARVSAGLGAAIETAERRLGESEALNRELIEHLPQIIFVKDRNLNYLFCNRVLAEKLGIESKDIVGKDDFRFFSREAAEKYRADDREIMEEGRIKDIEEEYEAAGRKRWVHTLKVPFRDGRGEIVGVLGIADDITGRKLAEAALRESELQLQVILEATADGILAVNNEGRTLKTNRRFAELWRIPAEILETGDDQALLDHVVGQLAEPEAFLRKVRSLYGSATIDLDTVLFKDGRIFERYSSPLLENGLVSGRVWSFRDITESKLHEAAAVAGDERVRLLLDSTGEGIYGTDIEGNCTLVNKSCLRMLGYDRAEELLGRFMHDVMHHSLPDGTPLPARSCPIYQAFRESRSIHISEGVFWRKDGSPIPVEAWSYPIFKEGKPIGAVATFVDITERKRAAESLAKSEEKLRQAQRMESVGRLAGGVAHDFNNILTAITGYAGFALEGLPEGDRRREDLKEVLIAAERAARLTRQLLAFSRKQILDPKVLDINSSVGGIVSMLKRLIGEDIRLETRLAARPCLAKLDSGQVEQVILNLAVNARDAMPKGGTLTFETGVVVPAGDFSSKHPDMPAGPLVFLSVRDTGCGMSEEVKSHLFEPFFTTKEKGKGTGLGLSMVYGIVKQSGGEIEVESAPGEGTAFRIYFPQIDASGGEEDGDEAQAAVPAGDETVLLVEDEETIRRLVERALSAGGYSVLAAADGREALEALERHGKPVDLLITDVVMPGISGRELARAVASKGMARRTLFVSGFTDNAIVRDGVLEPGLAFLFKPFAPEALLRKMREVLDGPAEQARP